MRDDAKYKAVIGRLVAEKALVFPDAFSGSYAAYPLGDRRKRPMCWLKAETFQALQAEGILLCKGKGFAVNERYIRGERPPQNDRSHRSEHRHIEGQDMYVPGGVKRPVRRNFSTSALHRIARLKSSDDQAFLSAHEVEAGEHFAKDYTLCGWDRVASQDYGAVQISSKRDVNSAQDRTASQLDARQRLTDARAALGPGLERAVMAVCVEDVSLDTVERVEKWARHSGRTVLKLGLQRLSEFYGTVPGQRAVRR